MGDGPYFRGLVAVDIRGSARRRETERIDRMHKGMYEVMRSAVDAAGIGWDACWRGDRGDGMILAVPADEVRKLVDPLVARMRSGLRRYNDSVGGFAAIQLRVALHIGLVEFERDDGSDALLGDPANFVCRLVDAPAVKQLAAAGGDLTLVVSDDVLHAVIMTYGAGLLSCDDFVEVAIDYKEAQAIAWAWPPPVARPPNRLAHPLWVQPPQPDTGAPSPPAHATGDDGASLGAIDTRAARMLDGDTGTDGKGQGGGPRGM